MKSKFRNGHIANGGEFLIVYKGIEIIGATHLIHGLDYSGQAMHDLKCEIADIKSERGGDCTFEIGMFGHIEAWCEKRGYSNPTRAAESRIVGF